MLLKIELPVDCELLVNSYDLEDLAKVISPLKIHGVITEDEEKEIKEKIARIDLRIRQTTKLH